MAKHSADELKKTLEEFLKASLKDPLNVDIVMRMVDVIEITAKIEALNRLAESANLK